VEKYNKDIATNGKVELIHVSMDFKKDDAQKWAAKNDFPWPTVLNENLKASGLDKYNKSNVQPFYNLIDKDGKIIATDKESSFQKIKELTQ